LEYGTDFGDRDTDGDGIRDGVELGLSKQFIEFYNGDVESSGSYFERIAHSGDHSPFNFTPIKNFDADNGATITDPLDPDTDDDGIPDGWIDGWYYGEEVFPRLYRTSNDDYWSRYDNLDYWEYNVKSWGRKMHPDNIRQVYEGEDMNLDGRTDDCKTIWSFDPYTFEICGSGETNSTERDTDNDGLEDGYEVWYSHLWPFFIFRNGTVEGLDPIRDDSNKDIDGVDILWDIGVMEGELNISTTDYTNLAGDPPFQDNHRRATNDMDFAMMINAPGPMSIQGFAQRLELKAGDIQDADFIEVKAEFYREVLVEIWEGRDENASVSGPHMVFPERCVYSKKLPPTYSDDGWIKIPLDGDFNYNYTIASSQTAPPTYFIVIRNSQTGFMGGPGLIWYSKPGSKDPYGQLVYSDMFFDVPMTPEEFQDFKNSMVDGIPSKRFTYKMFMPSWWYTNYGSSNTDFDSVIHNYTFAYRVIDLDKEAISLDIPRLSEDWASHNYSFSGTQNRIAIRLTNFTNRERINLTDYYFHVQTGDQGFNGEFYLMMGANPISPEVYIGDYGNNPDIINLGPYYSGWLHFSLHDKEYLDPDKLFYWLVFESGSDQPLYFTNTSQTLSGISYTYCEYQGSWENVTGFSPAFFVISDKFNESLYGDGLSNLHEFIIGTHPKKNNTDYMIIGDDVYNDGMTDGQEIFVNGSSKDYDKGGVIFRSSFKNGSSSFESYKEGYVHYDGDGAGKNSSVMNFTISRVVEDPPKDLAACSKEDLYHLFNLKDGSGVFLSKDFLMMYIWNKTEVIPDSVTGEDGSTYCPGTVVILERESGNCSMEYEPLDRYREFYFSNPFEIDTDMDGIVDGEEIRNVEDSDGDTMSNLRDTDSDNDKVLDRQEIRWNEDLISVLDTDDLENMIDPDSDNDGLEDGYETSWNFDTDGDGYENMIDPDSDGDGLADGFVDGYIFDWNSNNFTTYDSYKSTYGNDYAYPNETDNFFDPWEGEDWNMNQAHDQYEPDMTKVDTDGDSLWDGFDVYSDENRTSRTNRKGNTPLHFGELYFIDYHTSLSDKGMPFSGGDHNRLAQIITDDTTGIQMTLQYQGDSDGDGLTDYEEILPWYLKIEDFIPAYQYNGSIKVPESLYALNRLNTTKISSDPNNYDSDGDGLSDNDEYLFTNPLDKDSDNDGLSDKQENWHNFKCIDFGETNPCDRDTDNDGLPDGWADGWDYNETNAVEKITSGEMSYNKTDADNCWSLTATSVASCEIGEYRVIDGELVKISEPTISDTDYDGIADGIEFCYLWNVVHDPFADSDNDGKGDLFEIDSDNDGLYDGEENRDKDMFLDGWWAKYTPKEGTNFTSESLPYGGKWVDTNNYNLGYLIYHFNESKPTDPDCDDDGLLDSVEPEPFADTDGDGYLNVWDQDSNDCMGNGPGVGPKGWGNGIFTDCDDNTTTNNSMEYDHCNPDWWNNGTDWKETYIVFRTNATDTDNDRKIDYDDLENNVCSWVSVDIQVNLWKNQNPGSSISSSYYLNHSWSDTTFIINNTVDNRGSSERVKIHYDEQQTGEYRDLSTPEGYAVYYDSVTETIYIELEGGSYVECVRATTKWSSPPSCSNYSTSVNSVAHFARNLSETIDGRPALDLDPDRDGIVTPIENYYGLNPRDADTDNDGLKDGEEPEWWNNSDGDDQLYSGYSGPTYESI
ncbi:MAG: hypothetical protein DRP30_04900, partial [Thermotoga sp.]